MKKIIKCLGLSLFAIIIGIGSFLVPKFYNKQSLLVAKADSIDTSVTFNGSSLIQCATCVYTGSNIEFGFVNFSTSISYDNSSNIVTNSSFTFYLPDYYNGTRTDSFTISGLSVTTTQRELTFIKNGHTYYFVYKITGSAQLDISSIYKIHIESIPYRNNLSMSTDIYYYDSNNDYIKFSVIADSNDYQPVANLVNLFYYSPRDYYLSQDLTDNQLYNQGYQQGLSANQQDIYDNGYSAGRAAGRVEGYYEGLAEDTNYTFYGLIGAVIDVPVQTFMGLLNYELFGVNIAGFLLGLLTLGLILLIIKLILGGR